LKVELAACGKVVNVDAMTALFCIFIRQMATVICEIYISVPSIVNVFCSFAHEFNLFSKQYCICGAK